MHNAQFCCWNKDDYDDEDDEVYISGLYLVIKTELTERWYVLGPLNHHHQLLLHRLTNVLHVGGLLLIGAHRVHGHTHLYTTVQVQVQLSLYEDKIM